MQVKFIGVTEIRGIFQVTPWHMGRDKGRRKTSEILKIRCSTNDPLSLANSLQRKNRYSENLCIWEI